jgi:hypothetical protein
MNNTSNTRFLSSLTWAVHDSTAVYQICFENSSGCFQTRQPLPYTTGIPHSHQTALCLTIIIHTRMKTVKGAQLISQRTGRAYLLKQTTSRILQANTAALELPSVHLGCSRTLGVSKRSCCCLLLPAYCCMSTLSATMNKTARSVQQ